MTPPRETFRAARGFTLVELMVALTGGLFLSIMVFALARDTSRFYQRENRVAAATLAGIVGFERLKADIARAGYLSTANIASDPRVCTRPQGGWPLALRNLAGVRITPDSPDLSGNSAMSGNGITPDEILLAGSYAVTDEFPVRSVLGNVIKLQLAGSMARLGYLTLTDAILQQQLLQKVFGAGRAVRLMDQAGFKHFGVVQSVTGGPEPSITLEASPALEFTASATLACGITGFNGGGSLSVINFVRYQIRDLKSNTRFQQLFDQSAPAPGEATRTELVREELAANGTVIESTAAGGETTTELAAEYAVDLAFSVTAQFPIGSNALVNVAPGGANFTSVFNPAVGAIGSPQSVRAVRVRLSVRSREGDRDVNITNTALSPGLYRFKLPDGAWSRVRTFQADVALQNQTDERW